MDKGEHMRWKSMLAVLTVILFVAACSDSGGGGSTGNDDFDQNLVETWELISYIDEDGVQDWTGTLTFETNGDFDGHFEGGLDVEDVSGSATTSGGGITLTIEESNNWWNVGETGTMDYDLTGSVLTMNGMIDDEQTTLTFVVDGGGGDGTGELSGVVTTPGRAPVEDALITVVGGAASGYSGADGSYHITGIPAGTYTVRCSKDNYVIIEEPGVSIVDAQMTTLDFTLEPGGGGETIVTGYVADMVNLIAVAGAQVSIDGTSFSATTGSDGQYTITGAPAGTYDFTCTAAGYEDAHYPAIHIIEGVVNYEDFVLIPENTDLWGTLSGTVTNSATGTPVKNVAVNIDGLVNTGASFDDGTYQVLAIPEGTYSVNFVKPGYQTLTIPGISITSGNDTTLNAELDMIAGNGQLVVQVQNNLALPVSGASVVIEGSGVSGSTGPAGVCTLTGIPAGPYSVTISQSGYTSQTIENVEILANLPQYLYITLQ